jgi:DivIVA domain-containing protein
MRSSLLAAGATAPERRRAGTVRAALPPCRADGSLLVPAAVLRARQWQACARNRQPGREPLESSVRSYFRIHDIERSAGGHTEHMLTTDDLTSTRFTITRLREGYEATEVDEFLSNTTETLQQRDAEIRDLHDQVAAGCSCSGSTTTDATHGISAVEGSRAAARLLEIAARNADELLDEAKAEAASTRAAARTEAERMHAELEQTWTRQNTELDLHRTTVLSEVAERQAALEAEVSRLRQLDQDHRDRMRDYLNQQLAQIEPHTTG